MGCTTSDAGGIDMTGRFTECIYLIHHKEKTDLEESRVTALSFFPGKQLFSQVERLLACFSKR